MPMEELEEELKELEEKISAIENERGVLIIKMRPWRIRAETIRNKLNKHVPLDVDASELIREKGKDFHIKVHEKAKEIARARDADSITAADVAEALTQL